jgi:hypothetical protein
MGFPLHCIGYYSTNYEEMDVHKPDPRDLPS